MSASSRWTRAIYLSISAVAVSFISIVLFAQDGDPELNVLKMGLGAGTVTTSDGRINCGSLGTDCNETYTTTDSITLTANFDPAVSTFAGWDTDADGDTGTTPDCSGTGITCGPLTMNVARSVRPRFDLTTPIRQLTIFDTTTSLPSTRVLGPTDQLASNEVIRAEDVAAYLAANTAVDTPAEFVAALPPEFKINWLLMPRSESLQTGTAESPRLLLPSADGRFVFTIGMTEQSSYPGSHLNAIEYMQWDVVQKNFRFHEIVLFRIDELDPDGDGVGVIAVRPRNVYPDDAKCPKCHSTRNLQSLDRTDPTAPVTGRIIGTDGNPPGSVNVKNKPNWDPYDSWAGMLAFNRDRIYQGSSEAAAFRKLLNPWTWRTNEPVRQIIEQLKLQPAGVPSGPLPGAPDHRITRLKGGTNDGLIKFGFDTSGPVITEPTPTGPSSRPATYSFDRMVGPTPGSTVFQGGLFVTLHHTFDPMQDEGRGVHLFDLLFGQGTPVPPDTAFSNLNSQRIANEVINHHFATGSFPIEVRPLALAIAKGCFSRSGTTVTSAPARPLNLPFFNARNGGLNIEDLVNDSRARAESLPLRKADIQKRTLDRSGDPYLWGNPSPSPAVNGLVQQYGDNTSAGTDILMPRIRQEVFSRPTNAASCPGIFCPDNTAMGRIYADREEYLINTEQVALYRYFLEPLGVSVDKWSTGVRGRSRTYTFADVFGIFENTFIRDVEADLRPGPGTHPIPGLTAFECDDLIPLVSTTLTALPLPDSVTALPRYTDVQRIFNKNCIECHGGLDYPPYQNYGRRLDLSENETPAAGQDRLDRSYNLVAPFITSDPADSFIFDRITDYGTLTHPYNPDPAVTNEDCPFGLMPCGGPPLSKTDIETIRRWIVGASSNSRGDPHIQTIDGVAYDFQSAGEFVLLRGQGLEIQARQTAVGTDSPLPPNDHTGLRSCVSMNTAAAIRVGGRRITYQPNVSGEPDPQGLQLRIDGQLTTVSRAGLELDAGRIIQTTAPGGIQIEAPGGTVVVITPNWWPHYEVWYLDIDVRHARATEGVMGAIPAGNWLPALPDGTLLGPQTDDLHQRYVDLYDKFENAWRVTNATTLFDYAAGTSTDTFSVDGWPEENPRVCIAPPRQPGGPVNRSPLKALPLEAAQQPCAAIVGERTKANCIQDVMVTGEPIFAQGYLRAEQIERNALPAAPVLGFPERFKTDIAAPVNFTWNRTSDLNGDPLTYRHCVWDVNEQFAFSKCVVTPSQTTSSWRGGLLWAVLVLLLGCLLLAILIWLGLKQKQPALVYVLVIVILAGVVLAFYIGKTRSQAGAATLAKTDSGLQSGKAYYWKVIAEDGKGGTVTSETRRFEIK